MSITEIKARLTRKGNYESFYKYGESLASDLTIAQRFGMSRSYRGIISILKTSTKGKDLKFNELNLIL